MAKSAMRTPDQIKTAAQELLTVEPELIKTALWGKVLLGLGIPAALYAHFKSQNEARKRYWQGYNLAMQQLRPLMAGMQAPHGNWDLPPYQQTVTQPFMASPGQLR